MDCHIMTKNFQWNQWSQISDLFSSSRAMNKGILISEFKRKLFSTDVKIVSVKDNVKSNYN